MCSSDLACRGPDDAGVWIHGPAALGHRRLAVIDIEGGRQPMVVDTPNGPVALVYSGEVYNHAELRAELATAGHRFTTTSDTEVVLRGYLQWGAALVDRLNGMYAFAVFDARTDTLTLVRDRMGVKPLYYHPTPDGILFGSEPKAILAHPQVRKVVDLAGLRELFSFTKTPGNAIWSGMYELQPGHLLTRTPETTSTRAYWRLTTSPHTDQQGTTIKHVRDLLTDIVTRQLVADVPLCVLLSGGLD